MDDHSETGPATDEPRPTFREFVQSELSLTKQQRDLLVDIYTSWGL